jgi:flavin-dependent dehydrogenase
MHADLSDALIVGAGPTVLTLACLLARTGVSFRIIDASLTPPIGSRGKGLQPRSLELPERGKGRLLTHDFKCQEFTRQLGHTINEDTLFRHYRAVTMPDGTTVNRAVAKQFFAILPPAEPGVLTGLQGSP